MEIHSSEPHGPGHIFGGKLAHPNPAVPHNLAGSLMVVPTLPTASLCVYTCTCCLWVSSVVRLFVLAYTLLNTSLSQRQCFHNWCSEETTRGYLEAAEGICQITEHKESNQQFLSWPIFRLEVVKSWEIQLNREIQYNRELSPGDCQMRKPEGSQSEG